MRIAMPLAEGRLCMHFGHCQAFAFVEVDAENNIVSVETDTPPPHQPGVLPQWLGKKSVDLVIAGGMGMRAQEIFRHQGIDVVVGAPSQEPEQIATDYLEGKLRTGANICDH